MFGGKFMPSFLGAVRMRMWPGYIDRGARILVTQNQGQKRGGTAVIVKRNDANCPITVVTRVCGWWSLRIMGVGALYGPTGTVRSCFFTSGEQIFYEFR